MKSLVYRTHLKHLKHLRYYWQRIRWELPSQLDIRRITSHPVYTRRMVLDEVILTIT